MVTMKRGTRVRMKFGNERYVGTITSVLRRKVGSVASIRWDNGWHSTFGFGELELAEPERPLLVTANECELLIEALAARAARLESYGRAHPRTAAPNDRKAAMMRQLRTKLQNLETGMLPVKRK